ncbi:hypothetical protein EDD18DRAFT_1109503 [Armillaria luteobubalina]|uniref:Zn(2)-C6 fungal-type domain-containing protein n=1 Tax=Armillaria luteobubalina TaxID=153913 RepID=A0AA39PX45_9AGAR|nr:hypothetical protein EDD18DRAFT_1109503 [Armillaria luteobubalina]
MNGDVFLHLPKIHISVKRQNTLRGGKIIIRAGLPGCALKAVWHSRLNLLRTNPEHTFTQHGTDAPTPKDKKRLQNCDESFPVCNNCTKRDIDCVWGDTSLRPKSTTPEQSMVVAQSSSAENSLTLWTRGEGSSELLALELMCHYTTSVSYSLFPDPNASTVWRTIIPQMAFDPRNQCLLQAILAFSTLHIHHKNSTSSRYAEIAADYYNQARISLRMADADETVDINTVLVVLTLVSQYGFAVALTIFPFHGDWYNTMCKVCCNSQMSRTEMQYSVMQLLQAAIAPPLRVPFLNEPFPSVLSLILNSAPDDEELHDMSGGSFNRSVGLWWYMMSNTFLHLLELGRPRALIMLAHYWVMMKHVTQDGPWWAKKKWGDEASKIVFGLDMRWTPRLGWLLSQLDPGLNNQDFDLHAWVHVEDGDHF